MTKREYNEAIKFWDNATPKERMEYMKLYVEIKKIEKANLEEAIRIINEGVR